MNILLPTCWRDVTVGEFQQIALLDSKEKPSLRTANIISILTDIDNPFELDNGTVKEITETLSFMNEDISKSRLSEFTFNNIQYEWVKGFSEITLGEQISIEQTIEAEELNYHSSLDLVMAILLREKGKKFEANDIKKNRELFSSFPIDIVHGMILFFLSGGEMYLNNSVQFSVLPKKKMKVGLKTSKELTKPLKKKVSLLVISGLQWLIGLLKTI
jgi:hypothetical protein